jgi:hypothetical protein
MTNIYIGQNPPGADHGEPVPPPEGYRYGGVCKAKDLSQVFRLIELKQKYEQEKGK